MRAVVGNPLEGDPMDTTRRNILWCVGLLSAIALVLAGCATRIAPTSAPAPKAATAQPTASASAETRAAAGAIMGLEMREVRERRAKVQAARASGATWARYQVQWDQIEKERKDPPAYDWSDYDPAMRQLTSSGFRVVATIRENPVWASATRCGPLNAEGQQALPQFLAALVRRYSAAPYGVKHWEIYNEPDNADPVQFPDLGGCWGKDPAGYAAVLKLAYEAIKGADPQAVVLFGGIALEKFDGSPFNLDFAKQVLDAGGGPYFDWMNFHYYPAFSYRWDRFGVGVQGKAAYLRQVLRDAGIDKPLACSEIGQPSAGPAGEGYSDELTMRMIIREHAQALLADVQFAIWYGWQDKDGDVRAYGLMDADGEPKPALATYTLLANALGQSRFAGALAREETGNDKIEAYRLAVTARPGTTLVIAWRKDDGPALPLPIPAATAVVTDATGKATTISEGQAGDLNSSAGALSVGVGPAPVLIYYGAP